MCGAIPPPQYVFMACCLVKHTDNFTFYSKEDTKLPKCFVYSKHDTKVTKIPYCTVTSWIQLIRNIFVYSPPSSAEINNAWSSTSTPPTRLHGVVLS